jgi:hypothetical protein
MLEYVCIIQYIKQVSQVYNSGIAYHIYKHIHKIFCITLVLHNIRMYLMICWYLLDIKIINIIIKMY